MEEHTTTYEGILPSPKSNPIDQVFIDPTIKLQEM